jgi:hypothetical protein
LFENEFEKVRDLIVDENNQRIELQKKVVELEAKEKVLLFFMIS